MPIKSFNEKKYQKQLGLNLVYILYVCRSSYNAYHIATENLPIHCINVYVSFEKKIYKLFEFSFYFIMLSATVE